MIKTEADLGKLTSRQRDVLTRLVDGLSNEEIARLLQTVEATTKFDTAALLRVCEAVRQLFSRP
ncbi:MAG: LuxR C-terminal-related transcriptional regulator [Rhodoplanes sp.]|jgi:DNA-binding NarL/FixJ family response regulator